MKKFFAQNKPLVGIVAGLASELGYVVVLARGLIIAGEPISDHLRWFAGMFIPLILVLRHYAKGKEHLTVVKTLIVVFFVTFLAFIIYMLKAQIIVIQ